MDMEVPFWPDIGGQLLNNGRSKLWPIIWCSNVGRPKLGMISLRSMGATVKALLLVGKTLIHPVQVSMKTRRSLMHLIGGILIKSTCQSDPGKWPLAWWLGKEGCQMFDRGLVLEQMLQKDEISFNVLWKLGLGAIWVLIKWIKDRGLEWKTSWRAVNMGLICCSGSTRVLRNQYPLCWLTPHPEFLIVLFLFVCIYNESVQWPGGHLLGCLFSCGVLPNYD
jgi:hypothetical protein